jgi:hypothetical protein
MAYTPAIVPAYPVTNPAVAAFIVIPILLFAVLVRSIVAVWQRAGHSASAARRAGAITAAVSAIWMMATWMAAASGALQVWDRTPPPFALLLVGVITVSLSLAFSRAGYHLATYAPLWALVAVQSFRLPLELAMHRLYERGIMPSQMTYTGRNFDIVTGATAIVVALLVANGIGGRRLVAAWNVLGFALLVNIIVVAILSTPIFHYFGPDRLNTFVTYVPFIWLPAVMVTAALAGHLIIARALAR